jgi:hypothetical protein
MLLEGPRKRAQLRSRSCFVRRGSARQNVTSIVEAAENLKSKEAKIHLLFLNAYSGPLVYFLKGA